jgi:hypothetical protein
MVLLTTRTNWALILKRFEGNKIATINKNKIATINC